jgi:flagellin-specific chaperone FliS
MRAHQAYRNRREIGTTRIELILSLYDQAIDRLGQAEKLLEKDADSLRAKTLAGQVQTIVSGMSAGVVSKDPLSINFLRLYEFVAHRVSRPSVQNCRDAAKVLRTLREAFETVRSEATLLERSGEIPPLDSVQGVKVTA